MSKFILSFMGLLAYFAFGMTSLEAREVYAPDATPRAVTAIENQIGFNSSYHDDESNLIYKRARYYSPDKGIFISRDTQGYIDGESLYAAYFASMFALDPTGLSVYNEYDDYISEETPLNACDSETGVAACCCCVEDVNITNIKKISTLPLYGHSFNLKVDLKYVKGNGGDCSLKWEEKTNRPYPSVKAKGAKPNKWFDAGAMVPNATIWAPWKARTKPCPGKETVNLPDPPQAHTGLPKRVLYFRITVTSGKGCKCSTRSVTVYATQTLEGDGRGGIKTQDFSLGVAAGEL